MAEQVASKTGLKPKKTVKFLDRKHICQLDLRVRHTPPFGHPSPRGDGYAAQLYAYCYVKRLDIQTATASSPLGEGYPKGVVCRTRKPKSITT